jgi:hypothetical protein
MASAVASKVERKSVFLMDILASPSASGKTAASSTQEDATVNSRCERDLSIPKLSGGSTLKLWGQGFATTY